MKLATSAPPPAPSAWPQQRALPGLTCGPVRILVVDDCRGNRMLITAMLLRWRIVPAIACNGEQAVLLAQRQAFDLVLMDLMMPIMNGVVATARIRQLERESSVPVPVPIVAWTSLDLSADPAQLDRVGLSAVLPKPCSSTALQACLEHWCPGVSLRG